MSARNALGTSGWSEIWSFTTLLTGVKTGAEIPREFSLSQNYPNPFNPETNITFAIRQSSFVNLIVYDLLGREVTTLVSEKLGPGTYTARWDASGETSGVYFYHIKAGGFVETRKLLLLR